MRPGHCKLGLQYIVKRLAIRLVALLLLGLCPMLLMAEVVDQIVIEGNKKTRDEIIKQEMLLRVGDELNEQAIENSRQAIMDLGLFGRVEFSREQDGDITRLVVTVKEKKHDWYILPKLDRNADGDITLGMNLRANNFKGLNQSVKLTLAYKKFDDATTDELYGVSWKFPIRKLLIRRTRYLTMPVFRNLYWTKKETDSKDVMTVPNRCLVLAWVDGFHQRVLVRACAAAWA